MRTVGIGLRSREAWPKLAEPASRQRVPCGREDVVTAREDEPLLSVEEARAAYAAARDESAETQEEELSLDDLQLTINMAKGIALALFLHLFFLLPFLAGALDRPNWLWKAFVYVMVNLPLLAAAAWVWRRRLLPLSRDKVLRGKEARHAVLALLALDLLWFLWVVRGAE